MAKFKVSQEKEAELLNWMSALGIREEDIAERFVRGSGAGGQKINKTSSTVHLLHYPSGIEIKCQKSRSQSLNRYLARRELCAKLEAALLGKKSREQQERERIRRQKRRRSRRAKEKMLADKSERSKTKASRQKIRRDYES
ncbi:MAG: peptide chain release factor-like protein [Proteobacteria bacterium]|nr:MAG: peptide chain release factor-like protein [Pseudomonadota bacterium]